MTDPILTLTGPPGSGKSTAGRLVAERLHLELVSAGSIFRDEARKRSMDLGAFSRYAETHEEVDRSLDERMLALASPGRLLEGRITGALLRRRGVPVIFVVVTAPAEVRIARLADRDGLTLEETRRVTELREASERERYQRYYGIDLRTEPADLIVDSSTLSPELVADTIVRFVLARGGRP